MDLILCEGGDLGRGNLCHPERSTIVSGMDDDHGTCGDQLGDVDVGRVQEGGGIGRGDGLHQGGSFPCANQEGVFVVLVDEVGGADGEMLP